MKTIGWRERRRLRRQRKECRRLLEANRDQIDADQATAYQTTLANFKSALISGSRERVDDVLDQMDKQEKKLFPRPSYASWQELIDVILVAALVAFGGIRTFFVQPFKIPTASMEPTLYGVEPYPSQQPLPPWPKRFLDLVLCGEQYIEVIARADGRIDSVEMQTQQVADRWLFFFPRTAIELRVGNERYLIPLTRREFDKIAGSINPDVRAGQPILRSRLVAGDHILVDRLTYNFYRPRRGEIVVFDTTDLPVGSPGQFYIKRLTGVGGDILRIDPPHLYVNDQILDSRPAFQRIYSQENGYRGYQFAPTGKEGHFQHVLTDSLHTYQVPPGHYFIMGDNSPNSSDSRYWGPVPHKKFIGRAFLVYWPLSRRFGLAG